MATAEAQPRREEALLIFARLPREGEVKRRLAASVGAPLALQFYRACCKHVIPKLVHSQHARGVPTFVFWTGGREPKPADVTHPDDAGEAAMRQWITELGIADVAEARRQIDSEDLGERMGAALGEVHAAGHSKMVIVGTDIPDLSPRHVDAAFGALSQHQAVFGPAADGGYYLVGVNARSSLPLAMFQGIPWSTSGVLERTIEAAKALNVGVAPVETLPALRDVDTFDDLSEWHTSKVACGECASNSKLQGIGKGTDAPQRLCKIAVDVLEEGALLKELISETGYTFS